MANVCIVRHQGYIKSKMRLPYQHNFRTLKDYRNKNIDTSLTHLNTCIANNLKKGETYLTAFKRLRDSGEFQGQLKVQGSEEKQTKFLDEFLVYPPYEKITAMTLGEQESFFEKELNAIQKYFPDMIILSANVHRDEEFHPKDEEMKALFPEGKVTPHMHIIAIPIVHDKKMDCKKISITELWKGKFSYRKFQDYMYDAVGKEYGFDRGELHDYDEAQKHLEVEAFKLKEAMKSLNKLEAEIKMKEQSMVERARNLEPEEKITRRNINRVMENRREINYAWKLECEKNVQLKKEKDALNQALMDKEQIIHNQEQYIQNQQEKLSEVEKELSLEKDRTNEILNIKISNEQLRKQCIDDASQKIRLFDRMVKLIQQFLPQLKKVCPKFIQELMDYKILDNEEWSQGREDYRNHERK